MLEIVVSLLVVLPIFIVISIFSGLLVALLLKFWFSIREKNLSKLAEEYNFKFRANTPSYKQCIYSVIWPYALKEDHKTNFIEGELRGHKVFICDNFFSGPRFFGKPLNKNSRRTVVAIDDRDVKGKEQKTNFFKFQDGWLTSVYGLKRILDKLR